ncbi:hypothetical protein DENSPDRAFT_218688 [Dentipellis sp. KUC8613]|nr:hypothetical protein DENSPDRAFT_218688 [Dentipellis sp. KUC8613]
MLAFLLHCAWACIKAGHGTLFESRVANDVVGFTFHSLLLLPYFSWRATHHAHHKATGSVERDENYVPYHRADYGLPPARVARSADYAEVFEETPLWTLAKVLTMCIAGWWMYLTQNAMGAKMYPKGTNHFSPGSPLFKPHQRPLILLSDMGLVAVFGLLWVAARYVGWAGVARYYLVPYLLTNHWIVMFTYLHHSDPTIPHYYGPEWTFLRGALATVDRPLLGWMGRFFFHNISHDHIAHHLFVGAPFYHGPEITKHIKAVLGDEYNYDSTVRQFLASASPLELVITRTRTQNTFYAFWRSFTQCLFIEESTEGGIAFYKNGRGEAAREVAVGAVGLLQNGNQEKQADVATA